ncbi:hypothetical protein H4219_001008 [Mycoemilia scoparia]|uniref:B box-type domain-containing protein n=1 Tax=Mycoemilia scoparia TaxID=417184 RepID=A0A9W8DSE5_9FUNG|nr:hypothetical protein H4219_001008 [Mycoemilia scoparia]
MSFSPRKPGTFSETVSTNGNSSRLRKLLEDDSADSSTLATTLDDSSENEQYTGKGGHDEDSDSNSEDNQIVPEGFCVECRDQRSYLFCKQCDEEFCEVCSAMLHRTGKRKQHDQKRLQRSDVDTEANMLDTANGTQTAVSSASSANHVGKKDDDDSDNESIDKTSEMQVETIDETAEATHDSKYSSIELLIKSGAAEFDFKHQNGRLITNGGTDFNKWITERAKYIPVRLTLNEKKYLRLIEAALNVSEYTDKIDILSYGNKNKRIVAQIKSLCAILSGLVLSSDYKAGQKLFQDKKFEDNKEFYQKIFEIGRRYKVMNPEKMRGSYGKLMYLLQDSAIPQVSEMLGFELVQPIKTVYSVLEENGMLHVLEDEDIEIATREIIATGKTRRQIQMEVKQKERALESLSRNYATADLPAEELRQCIYSIGDNHAYLRFNRDPCDRMIDYLKTYFNSKAAESDDLSLSIFYGRNGSRLSHSHQAQYRYVLQTLTLWREVLHDMFMLWYKADQDLLSKNNRYRLVDTGQGLNRVQGCPQVSKAIHTVLHRTQKSCNGWVGSSVIHLGDHNVPNALMFIDKYNQIAPILNPIVRCLEFIESAARGQVDPKVREYMDSAFGDPEHLLKLVLADFFRSAFDGSGADNFFDAGSCIDGRLTSAWNWCSQIEKKPYFPAFLLSGFVGFNGSSDAY